MKIIRSRYGQKKTIRISLILKNWKILLKSLWYLLFTVIRAHVHTISIFQKKLSNKYFLNLGRNFKTKHGKYCSTKNKQFESYDISWVSFQKKQEFPKWFKVIPNFQYLINNKTITKQSLSEQTRSCYC